MKKVKIIPGMICSIDPNNTLSQDQSGINHVEIIKRIKYRPFGNSLWKIRILDEFDDSSIGSCVEKYLYPDNMCLIRFPIDMPVINGNDISILTDVIKILHNMAYPKEKVDRLKALREKLNLYKQMREV